MQRIYIDTSVVGGYFEEEFKAYTIPFFESVRRGERIIIVSELLEDELTNAPREVRLLLKTIPMEYRKRVLSTPEAALLADAYIAANVVGATSRNDCLHIAIATLCKAHCLVSWNFKHIVNDVRIAGYNKINYERGFNTMDILTPKDLMNNENNC
ncbi:MAG: hypothetical protein LBS63_03040 [Prevotellaceae bacterium]|jgi:hypothetical protein|nr:hypothetical protein [Prevotellaceae bacterium]